MQTFWPWSERWASAWTRRQSRGGWGRPWARRRGCSSFSRPPCRSSCCPRGSLTRLLDKILYRSQTLSVKRIQSWTFAGFFLSKRLSLILKGGLPWNNRKWPILATVTVIDILTRYDGEQAPAEWAKHPLHAVVLVLALQQLEAEGVPHADGDGKGRVGHDVQDKVHLEK